MFIAMMDKRRHVPPPAQMDVAIPANMRAGRLLEGDLRRGSAK
jgi:hypothetical protein